MFRHIEIAMTHSAVAAGMAERITRPVADAEMATRLQRWGVVAESCQSCHSLLATRVVSGLPLCGRCHGQREQRLGRTPEGLAPVTAMRADAPTSDRVLEGYGVVFNSRSVDMGFF